MATGSTVKVTFEGDSKSLERTLGRVTRSSNQTSKSVGRAGIRMKTLFAGLGVAALAVATKKMYDFGSSAVKAASDMNESLSKTNVVFGKSAKGIRKWASTAASSMGISTQAALEQSSTLGNLLGSMGNTKSAAAKMSKTMVTLAADIGSFNNVDPNEVLMAMRSGLTGEIAPLRRFGVNLTDVTLKAQAMKMGLYNGKGALTTAAKSAAAYKLILKQTKPAQGDVDRTAGGLANQLKFLGAHVDDLKAKLGKGLLPVVISVVKFLNTSAIPFVTKFANGFSKEAGPAISKVGKWIKSDLVPALKTIWEWLATKVYPIWKQYATFLITKVYPVLVKIAQQALEGVRAALETVRKKIEENRPQLEALWAGFKKVADFIVTKVVPVLGPILKKVFEGAGIAIGFLITVISKLPEQAKGILDYFIRPVTQLFLMFADTVVSAADTAFGWIPGLGGKLDSAKKAVKKFRSDTQALLAGWSETLGGIGKNAGENLNKGLVEGLRKDGKTLAEARYLAAKIKQITNNEFEIKSPSKWAIRVGKYIGQGLAIGITKGGDAAKSAMTKMVDRIKGILQASRDKLRSLRDTSKSYAKDIASTITGSGGLSAATAGTEGEADHKSTFGDISGQLSKALNQAKQFSTLVKRLRKEGVARSLIAQVLQMGPGDGNSLAEAILQGGTSGIASLNKMQAELNKVGAQTGAFQAQQQYGAAISAQEARVKNQTNVFHIAVKADSPEEFIRQFRKYVRTHGGLDAVFG